LRVLLGGAFVSMLFGSGCQSMNNTESGLTAGGALGAIIGALAAGPRHALAGAVIGGAGGAAAGGLIGASKDNAIQQASAARAEALRHPALSLEDIARLSQSGISDEVIIGQIYNSGSVYYLQAEHILWLQNNGVREPVIRAMQSTVNRLPVVAAGPAYVVEPAPPPPPIGVGVGMTFVGRRW
jgi:hypothetical protein